MASKAKPSRLGDCDVGFVWIASLSLAMTAEAGSFYRQHSHRLRVANIYNIKCILMISWARRRLSSCSDSDSRGICRRPSPRPRRFVAMRRGAIRRETSCLRRGALEVERQQALQRVLGRDVLRPAVGGGDGAVERVVGVGEPARALVVEVGQRARLELRPPPRRSWAGCGRDSGAAPRRARRSASPRARCRRGRAD